MKRILTRGATVFALLVTLCAAPHASAQGTSTTPSTTPAAEPSATPGDDAAAEPDTGDADAAGADQTTEAETPEAAPELAPPSEPAPPAASEPAPPPEPSYMPSDAELEPASVRSGPRKLMLLIGPGFGFSFMYPKEVNDYLDAWVDQQGAMVEEGTSAIVLSIQPKLAITFAPIEYVQIQVVGEIGWAPKIIAVIGGDSESFHYMRYSVGGTVAGHIPISNGRRSISIGGGALFNVLQFKGLKKMAPGGRGVFGFRFYGRRAFVPEIFVEFNWIKADTGNDSMRNDPMDIGEEIRALNYVSGTIGGNFYFKVVEKK